MKNINAMAIPRTISIAITGFGKSRCRNRNWMANIKVSIGIKRTSNKSNAEIYERSPIALDGNNRSETMPMRKLNAKHTIKGAKPIKSTPKIKSQIFFRIFIYGLKKLGYLNFLITRSNASKPSSNFSISGPKLMRQ